MAMNILTQTICNRIIVAATQEGVPHHICQFIASQSRVETGNFTSSLFTDDKNGFGMKIPAVRKTPYIIGPATLGKVKNAPPKSEGNTNYARYASIEDSTKDLVNWLRYNKVDFTKIQSVEDYVAFLGKKGFFGISVKAYLTQVNKYYQDFIA
jgi:flagellum-specific peptidoglycan hydrolase FlgJ